jgi:signal transduction histidine kinase
VGELLAEVVHEVRNGLVSIKTCVQLLPEHRGEAEFETRFREVTREEFDRIERLLAAVLDQASGRGSSAGESRDSPAADPLRAVEGVSALLKLRADKCGVTLVNACREGGLLNIADDALRQVLLNLVLNAFSVCERGDEVRLSTRQHGSFLEIRIEDQGPGVERADRERIFEPFFTTRSESTGGLGLAISRRLVEEAGGTLSLREGEGGGSCFRIRIPFRESDRSDPGLDPRSLG